jgi:hypothetical protein
MSPSQASISRHNDGDTLQPDRDERRPGVLPPPTIALRLLSAYQVAQTVRTATELGVTDILGDGALACEEIAQATGTQADRMRRLLRALAALDVVKDLGSGKFELTPVGHCLRADVPNSVRPLARLSGSVREAFGSLAECVKTGKNAFEILHGVEGPFAYLAKHPDLARAFDDAMTAFSAFTGPAVAQSYDFAGVRHVIDVAGGHGHVLASILKAHPHLRGTLLDVPRVVEGARAFLAKEGVADRCDVVEGNMFASVPAHGDLYLLSHILHDWDEERAGAVLQACRRAMAPQSKLLIADLVLPERAEPNPVMQNNMLFDLVMMVWTGGRERTEGELRALLNAARLRLVGVIPMPMQIADSLVEATPA